MKLALNIIRLCCCVFMGFGFAASITSKSTFEFLIGSLFFFVGLMGYIDIRIAQNREHHI